MKKSGETLAQRRERLISRCHAQREELARQRRSLQQSLGMFSSATRLAGQARKSPLLLAGAAAGLMLIRPRRLFSFLASATMAWQAWQKIAPIIKHLGAPLFKRPAK